MFLTLQSSRSPNDIQPEKLRHRKWQNTKIVQKWVRHVNVVCLALNLGEFETSIDASIAPCIGPESMVPPTRFYAPGSCRVNWESRTSTGRWLSLLRCFAAPLLCCIIYSTVHNLFHLELLSCIYIEFSFGTRVFKDFYIYSALILRWNYHDYSPLLSNARICTWVRKDVILFDVASK